MTTYDKETALSHLHISGRHTACIMFYKITGKRQQVKLINYFILIALCHFSYFIINKNKFIYIIKLYLV